MKRFKFGMRTVLTVAAIVAIALGWRLFEKRREQVAVLKFGDEGSITRSWVGHHARSTIDRTTGFVGFVRSVMMDGSDPNLRDQIRMLPTFKRLNEFSASGVHLHDEELPDLECLPQLREISFSDCSAEFIELLLKKSPNLRTVAVWECGGFGDEGLRLALSLDDLERLDINGSGVSGTPFANGAVVPPNLSELEIAWSPITPSSATAIMDCDRITAMFLSDSSGHRYVWGDQPGDDE